MHVFEDNLDSKKLKKILQKHVVECALETWPNEQWYYQQDNDPKHRSALVSTFFHENGITVLDHPPYSPDLNPIENLWKIVRTRVDDRMPRTIDEIKQFWEDEWSKTTKEERTKLTHSMIRRFKAVIKCNGNKIDY